MKIRHEVCLDHNKELTAQRCADILSACGHSPTCKLRADTPTDTVHGSVSIAFCNTVTLADPVAVAASVAEFERRATLMGRDLKDPAIAKDIVKLAAADLGADVLMFKDGHLEVATQENVDAYWKEQGKNADGTYIHRLEKIVGNKAYGNTIIDVEVYEDDVPAGREPHPWLPGATIPSTRQSRLKRPVVMPTSESIKASINTKMQAIGKKMR